MKKKSRSKTPSLFLITVSFEIWKSSLCSWRHEFEGKNCRIWTCCWCSRTSTSERLATQSPPKRAKPSLKGLLRYYDFHFFLWIFSIFQTFLIDFSCNMSRKNQQIESQIIFFIEDQVLNGFFKKNEKFDFCSWTSDWRTATHASARKSPSRRGWLVELRLVEWPSGMVCSPFQPLCFSPFSSIPYHFLFVINKLLLLGKLYWCKKSSLEDWLNFWGWFYEGDW